VIALLGDTHLPRGTRRLPDGCVEVLARADAILHVGDFTAASVLEELRAFAPVHAVYGNVDELSLREALPARLVVEVEGVRVGLVHDSGPSVGRSARLREWFPGCDVVAYGHTHLPEIVSDAGVWIVNPGSPTERRRAPAHTMAVIQGGVPELVTLG
jgi:putative phosphoesterase